MNAHHSLQGVERIFAGRFFIINISFGYQVIFFVTRHQIDMFFAMRIHGGFQAEMGVNSFLKLLSEIRHFFNYAFQFGTIQGKEYARSNGAHGYRRWFIGNNIGLAKIFAFG